MDVLRCMSPEMVTKEIWIHLLAYNLIRGVLAKAAKAHELRPRALSFKGALQTMTAFQDMLRRARPGEREHLMTEMLKAIAHHRVGDRFGRVEPRANKRRPKPQRYLMEPRRAVRKTLAKSRLTRKPGAIPLRARCHPPPRAFGASVPASRRRCMSRLTNERLTRNRLAI